MPTLEDDHHNSEKVKPLGYEVNFLTEDIGLGGGNSIRAIKAEFDLIQLWWAMVPPFGIDASKILDKHIALSLRKLLCDPNAILKDICPDFKMPPLPDQVIEYSGDNKELMLVKAAVNLAINPQKEWIPLDEWLEEKYAWIDKDANSIPDEYENGFFQKIIAKQGCRAFKELFSRKYIDDNGSRNIVWEIKDPVNGRQRAYEILKCQGYYDLTIQRMIKHVADKQAAHLDRNISLWIDAVNNTEEMWRSAISVFAMQMIYAATKQIRELKDYRIIPITEMQ